MCYNILLHIIIMFIAVIIIFINTGIIRLINIQYINNRIIITVIMRINNLTPNVIIMLIDVITML